MAVKLIAVDMDGTFLDDEKNYDQERFFRQYQKMKEQGIRFVVASGNQYYQLMSFFEPIHEEISFVSENRAFVVMQGKELFSVDIPKRDVRFVMDELMRHTNISVVVCGKESAYVLEDLPEDVFVEAKRYYPRLKRVPTFHGVEDQILKFALACPPDKTRQLQELLHTKIRKVVTPVSSGHGSIDLIVPEFHKASGLQRLQKVGHIQPDEMMAFGDGGNDIEMLKHVKYGFAMENGSEEVKKAARYAAPSNNESGVLAVIEQYFAKVGPFKD